MRHIPLYDCLLRLELGSCHPPNAQICRAIEPTACMLDKWQIVLNSAYTIFERIVASVIHLPCGASKVRHPLLQTRN